jgi:DNA-binding NtrC family response regulator
VEGIAPDAVELLTNYSWPGNVRELLSVVRQSLLNATGPVIVPEFLPEAVRRFSGKPVSAIPHSPTQDTDLKQFIETRLQAGSTDLYAEALEAMERYLIARVLQETAGNQSKAAKILGITRGKIRDRIAEFNVVLNKVVNFEPKG